MRLLVAYDGSEGGRDALELGRVLCTATGASALVIGKRAAQPAREQFAGRAILAAAGPLQPGADEAPSTICSAVPPTRLLLAELENAG